ncbi:MAG TPA: hypothetical protein PLO51_05070, partial [Candidatus Micrarchaeota archaeon]|nr:hypothetical protein [Candidatus Micrarchaeota archaeon]
MGTNTGQITRANKKSAKDIFDSTKLGTDTEKLAKFTISRNDDTKNIMFKVQNSDSGKKSQGSIQRNETISKEIKKGSKFKKTAYMFAALSLTAPVVKDMSQAIFDLNVKDGTELMAQTQTLADNKGAGTKGGDGKTQKGADNLPVIPK